MYTVLLVDDEDDVTQVIKKKVPWEELGFSVVGLANNGVKALELVEEYQPDVVMTDIRMPYMDGMELTKRIRSEFPTTKILLFTGFDEFEYAKEAIHLEVDEYILKPLNCTELTKVFQRLYQKLDSEIREKRNVQTLQKYYTDSLPLLRANFYTMLIEGRLAKTQIEKYLKDYQISFEKPYFCCLVMHTSAEEVPDGMTPLLLMTSVEKQAQEYMAEKWKTRSFSYMGNTVGIVELDREADVALLTDDCDRFCRYVHRMLGAVTTVGIGKACDSLMELSDSYNGAREAVSYRGIYGAMRAINIREIAPQEMYSSGTETEMELSQLFKKIRLGAEEDVTEAVNHYVDKLTIRSKSMLQHHVDIMDMIGDFYRFAANNEIAGQETEKDIGQLYSQLMDMDPEALRKWIQERSLEYHNRLAAVRNSSTRSFVQRAKEYVQNSYADENISLDQICDMLGVSNSYFSTIFKKETGESFVTYLTGYRLDQAARLLIETNEKSYMIAQKVGYTDSNYFSYVFKRRFGVSPSKYRTEHTEDTKK